VEFAFIVPLLVLLVLGIAEFGRAYYLQTTVSNAAREGARVMALSDDQARAREAAKTAATTVALADSQITFSTGSCTPETQVTATVSYPMEFLTGMFGANLTLEGKGVMLCNG
jgi:Flp pilus assembly protein TadG